VLGHGAIEHESVPKLVTALAGKRVIGAAAGNEHTRRVTQGSSLLGWTLPGGLGHGGYQHEVVPRLIEALLDA